MYGRVYTIENIFDATVSDVWRAITEKELMKQWYFDLAEFKPEVGFVFEFKGEGTEGTPYMHRCEITEVVFEKKLSHTWSYVGYGGMSYLTFELFAIGNKTKLVLTHAGLESFPAEVVDFAYHNFEEGWNQIICISLTDFLAKK
jgi:uncharacterized protein YndB with AHSA1/START domain